MKDLRQSETIADLIHEKSVEILAEVGFCVPDKGVLARLDSAGFSVNRTLSPERVDAAAEMLFTVVGAQMYSGPG
ncbi:MAG: hypothetical protein MUO62_10895 [Anaerolineales bacterium]|nr:hypothetical protein [Anaerolineales bacterium]